MTGREQDPLEANRRVLIDIYLEKMEATQRLAGMVLRSIGIHTVPNGISTTTLKATEIGNNGGDNSIPTINIVSFRDEGGEIAPRLVTYRSTNGDEIAIDGMQSLVYNKTQILEADGNPSRGSFHLGEDEESLFKSYQALNAMNGLLESNLARKTNSN